MRVAIYLCGHVPYREPRLIEMQQLRIERYYAGLQIKHNFNMMLIGDRYRCAFIDYLLNVVVNFNIFIIGKRKIYQDPNRVGVCWWRVYVRLCCSNR